MITVEETTLLRAFDTSNRRVAILSLMNGMGMMQDDELTSRCRDMVKKLEKTTDAEFYSFDFTVYDDDEVNDTASTGKIPGGEKEADNE